ncbi:hypothetical protein KIL84_001556 [Mauremys mutica]|uniref:Uncharacterized protein n=1 Tax=Mauremys mutica TaxID=74926 RepID=A0A9D3XIL1_9SAUR|nr:hypothetical protein KIL84_001556 [Mauremys mutica]
MPRAGLLLLPLLLCFGPETAGSIDTAVLKDIVDHVHPSWVTAQYSFAVSLNTTYCQNTTGLEQELPVRQLRSMRNAIRQNSQEGGLYDPADGNIVAASVNYLNEKAREHTEWRLLHSDQNQKSPVQKLLDRTYKNNSCLIFFTLNSPCVRTCLPMNKPFNILNMVKNTFHPIDNNFKAFVFQQIYQETMKPEMRLQAWQQLNDVPLYRCDKDGCRDCSGNNPNTNPCLDRR